MSQTKRLSLLSSRGDLPGLCWQSLQHQVPIRYRCSTPSRFRRLVTHARSGLSSCLKPDDHEDWKAGRIGSITTHIPGRVEFYCLAEGHGFSRAVSASNVNAASVAEVRSLALHLVFALLLPNAKSGKDTVQHLVPRRNPRQPIHPLQRPVQIQQHHLVRNPIPYRTLRRRHSLVCN